MQTGAFTGYLDVAQVVLYAFWVFFAGLIFYLRQEDKREGYPLVRDPADRTFGVVEGFPPVPDPKQYVLVGGRTVEAPRYEPEQREIRLQPGNVWPGAPFVPTGDPMRDGVGPASYAMRQQEPELTWAGEKRVVPLRVATDFWVEERDPDPRGMEVVGADGVLAGTVSDLWIDRAEPQIRYLEVVLDTQPGRNALLPINFASISAARRQVNVSAILASQFGNVPGLTSPDQVTAREEDAITGYYGGGKLYATPARAEPLL
ncbi:MAG: photosynthetic reaction center subunit H [Xanthobacteraceae bacterium]